MNIKCIAVDDEPLALAQISAYIKKVPFLELVASCYDALEAMKVLSESKVDLIFIDINMPDINGLDFVRTLIDKPMVVFTTAYSEYGVDGFKVDAVDYLLKPFDFQDLLIAAEKAFKRYDYLHHNMKRERDLNNQPIKEGNSIFVKSDYRIVRINIYDIKYIEGMSEYVRFYIEGENKPIISLLSMKKIEDLLPSSHFMRVHRSYIVNLQRILEVSRLRIVFDKNTYIPIGDNYKSKFNAYIINHSFNK